MIIKSLILTNEQMMSQVELKIKQALGLFSAEYLGVYYAAVSRQLRMWKRGYEKEGKRQNV